MNAGERGWCTGGDARLSLDSAITAMAVRIVNCGRDSTDSHPSSCLLKAGRSLSLQHKSVTFKGVSSSRAVMTEPEQPSQRLSVLYLSQAKWILAHSRTCPPNLVLSAASFLVKSGQVRSSGCMSVTGILPGALKAYVSSQPGNQHHVPLAALKQAVAEWAFEAMQVQPFDALPCANTTEFAKAVHPVITAINKSFATSQTDTCRLQCSSEYMLQAFKIWRKTLVERVAGSSTLWDPDALQAEGYSLRNAMIIEAGQNVRTGAVALSKLCLSSNSWVCSIRLSLTRDCEPAFIGLQDATDEVLGYSQKMPTCLMLSTDGSLKISWGDQDSKQAYCKSFSTGKREIDVKIHLDMSARTCGFSVGGVYKGVAFQDVPRFVKPAVILPPGGKANFMYIDSHSD